MPHVNHALLSRTVAALFGGYVLAALGSVAALALPMARSDAVIVGMLTSFGIYAVAALGVFAARSATRAWVGLTIAGLALCAVGWFGGTGQA